MSVQRTYYCEGPDCGDAPEGSPVHGSTASPPPHLLVGWIQTRERTNGEDFMHDFCSWPCLMKFAASKPEPERIEWDDISGGAA